MAEFSYKPCFLNPKAVWAVAFGAGQVRGAGLCGARVLWGGGCVGPRCVSSDQYACLKRSHARVIVLALADLQLYLLTLVQVGNSDLYGGLRELNILFTGIVVVSDTCP